MLIALLTAAMFVGLLDVLISWPGPGEPFFREATILVSAGNLLVALVVGSGLWLLGRIFTRARLHAGQGLLVGGALALGPAIGNLTENGRIGMGATLLMVPLAVLLGRRWSASLRWCRFALLPLLAAPLVLTLLETSLTPSLPAEFARKPAEGLDVVLVSIDTLRADRMDARRMPTLTRLAAQGICADFALAPADITLPSHVTLLSGLTPLEHGVRTNNERMDPSIPLLQERFLDAGWRTAAVVSNNAICGDAGFRRGFEVFDESPIVKGGPINRFRRDLGRHTWLGWTRMSLRAPAWTEELLYGLENPAVGGNAGNARLTTDHSLALLDQLLVQESPYFLFVHYMDPHTPYCPPPESAGTFSRPSSLPERYRNGEPNVANWGLVNRIGEDLQNDVEEGMDAIAHAADLYDEEVLYVDLMLAELLSRIEAGGRDTLLLVTADHGEQFGEHRLVMHANSLFEPNLRVPLVFTGPAIPARVLTRPPHLEDVAVTLLACAGLPGDDLCGHDLREPLPDRRHVAIRRKVVALRDADWKLIARFRDDDGELLLEPVRLYHLATDPEEQENRLRSEPEVVRRLVEQTEAALRKPSLYQSSHDVSDRDREALRALGYVVDDDE